MQHRNKPPAPTAPTARQRTAQTNHPPPHPDGGDYDVPVTIRVRGSSSAAQQQQKSFAFDSYTPGNETKKGDIKFMGGWGWRVGGAGWRLCRVNPHIIH
jgi:hypothetical protein